MNLKIWIEKQLSGHIPSDVRAYNFNLYESEIDNQFDVQLIGCKEYDLDNDDWACNPDYSSGENFYHFTADGWEQALESFIVSVKEYLETCNLSNKLKAAKYITAGFVDGDLEVIVRN